MRKQKLIWALALINTCVATIAFSAPPQEETPQVKEELKVIVRDVRVHVVDKFGEHVPGLTKEDFVVKEGGDPVEVQYFEEVDLSELENLPQKKNDVAEAPSEGEPVEDGAEGLNTPVRRTIVVLIDSSHMTREFFDSVIESANEFFDYEMTDNDLVKIVHLDREFRHITPFTNDRIKLKNSLKDITYLGHLRTKLEGLDKQIGSELADYMADLNDSPARTEAPVMLDEVVAMTRASRGSAERLNRPGEETQLNRAFLEAAQAGLYLINELTRNKEQIKLDHFILLQKNLMLLSSILKYMPGSKSVFYFNGGSFLEEGGRFQASIPLMDEVARALNSADTTIYSYHARKKINVAQQAAAGSPYISDLNVMESMGNLVSFVDQQDHLIKTNNTLVENSIQSSTGPLAAARETGGAYIESGDPGEIRSAFTQINSASSHFYRIAYLTRASSGRSKVSITLKNKQKNWEVRYGNEFAPDKVFNKLNQEELSLSAETALLYGRMKNNDIAASAGYDLLRDGNDHLVMPVYLRIDAPPENEKGFQLGFATVDNDFRWLDRTLSSIPSLKGKSDLVFYDLLLPEKMPETLRFYLRNLDNGQESLFTVNEPGNRFDPQKSLLLGDPESKNLIPMNHLRKDPEQLPTTSQVPLITRRKNLDPFWFRDYLFVPANNPEYESDSIVDLFFTVEPGFSHENARYFMEGEDGREALEGRIVKENFQLDGRQALVARVQLPVLTPGSYNMVVEVTPAAGDAISMSRPFRVKASGDVPSKEKLTMRLFDMIEKESLTQMKALLGMGADINATDSLGNTLLLAACQKNNEAMVRTILAEGVDVQAANNQGVSAVMVSSAWGSEDITRMLLTRGADPNSADFNKNTALFYAADGGHAKVVEILLAAGADPNVVNDRSETPLIMAARANRPRVLRALVTSGAEMNYLDATDRSPLMHAIIRNSSRAVKELIDLGADVNFMGQTKVSPLMYAAITQNDDTCRALIKKGADVNGREANGNTAVALISDLGLSDMIRQMAKMGAQLNTVNAFGETPLIMATINNHTGTVKALVEAGAKVNMANKGVTALMLAAFNGDEEMVKTLLSKGADPTLADDDGQTALNYAQRGGKESVLALLKK